MNDKLKSVLGKITALRALAANAGTLAEAEAAAAHAEALIAKYQVDEDDIETADPSRAETIGEDAPLWEGSQRKTWIDKLCHNLCVDHGCATIFTKNAGKTVYRIAGRPSDVAVVRYLFAWLTVEISRMAEREHDTAARNAFRRGAVVGVIRAMRAARAADSAPTAQCFGLVLRDRAAESMTALERAIRSEVGGVARFTRRGAASVSDADAYGRGRAAGGNMAPRTALPAGGARLMLGAGR